MHLNDLGHVHHEGLSGFDGSRRTTTVGILHNRNGFQNVLVALFGGELWKGRGGVKDAGINGAIDERNLHVLTHQRQQQVQKAFAEGGIVAGGSVVVDGLAQAGRRKRLEWFAPRVGFDSRCNNGGCWAAIIKKDDKNEAFFEKNKAEERVVFATSRRNS